MNKKSNFINEILNDLRNTSMYLKEAYVFDDEPDMHEEEPSMMQHHEDPSMMQHQQQQMQQGDSAEEQAMHAQEIIKHEPIIAKIRETAIEGLRKYADNPTSSLYEFFKKVFLESDKVLTDTGSSK